MRFPRLLSLILLESSLLFSLYAQDWKTYPYLPEGSLISFPKDEGHHPGEAIEWWYVAGQLNGESSGNSYHFMLTYFHYPGDSFGFHYDGFRILNLSNEKSGEFYSETMPVMRFDDLATDHLHIDALLFNQLREHWDHREDEQGSRIPFEYELSASSQHGSIDLGLTSTKRPLIPGGDGFFKQGASSYTYYFSLTHNLVRGRIQLGDLEEAVEGKAWIDRQWGNNNPYSGEKYEWFYVQLSNGMDLNIWNLFTGEMRLPASPEYRHLSVYVNENQQSTSSDFEIERKSWQEIQGSGNVYACQWRLYSEPLQMELLLQATEANSEVELPFAFYEGPVEVSGTIQGAEVGGIGFAELLKHYQDPRPRILKPQRTWNKEKPICWILENPDDGRPVTYALSYSIDKGLSWLPIAEELTDTCCFWNNPPLSNGDSCLFRLSAYSSDHSLSGSWLNKQHTIYEQATASPKYGGPGTFKIWPNPARESIYIRGDNPHWQAESTLLEYTIWAMDGKIRMRGILDSEMINLGALERGNYMLQINNQKKILGTASFMVLD